MPLDGGAPLLPADALKRITAVFQQGNLTDSQELAARASARLQATAPAWAARFTILEAESAAWRGANPEVLRLLEAPAPAWADPGIAIQRLALLGLARAHMHQFDQAQAAFAQAQAACAAREAEPCGELLRARGGMAMEQGQYKSAYRLWAESLASAQRFNRPWDESVALLNLGTACLMEEDFDEAIGWLRRAQRLAVELNAGDVLATTLGNLGWAYYKIGDAEKALAAFNDAERRSVALGDTGGAITWLTTAGVIYQDSHDLPRASQYYLRALQLARQINSKEDIVNSLELLADLAVDGEDDNKAGAYIAELNPLIQADGNRLDALDVTLAQARIEAARRNDQKAEELFRTVDRDQDALAYMRLAAEHHMAVLFQQQGKPAQADKMYKTALNTFESSRQQLKEETSRLPFLANATPIYDDYIQFLVAQGKPESALLVADQSRARTLAQGLEPAARVPSLSPRAVAGKTGATLLFYWLGERQSCLWAITPEAVTLFPLPPRREMDALVERYRRDLLDAESLLHEDNDDAKALYRLLVAPAARLLQPNAPVILLNDGELARLNFETLLAPGPSPHQPPAETPHTSLNVHYFVEDATLVSAPSLAMLAAASAPREQLRSLLLVGNPLSPGPDFPTLPLFGFEMSQMERHFATGHHAVFTGQQATPASYLSSHPEQYAYIHFVAHAVASRTDPLDSAIVLSPSPSASDAYKLYARDIMRLPIHARLVTISACNGSGARVYAGEGLVGLSWAFLRAGAQNTVAALWEVSDESTPRLMDALYQGMEEGLSPAAALRQAKLSLLHAPGRFRDPFYWAPFQIYTRQ